MSIELLENDEEIIWQSKISLKFQKIIFLISLPAFIISIIIDNFILKFISTSITDDIFPFVAILIPLIIIFITCTPLFGILYSIGKSSAVIIEDSSFFATNKRIVDEWENRKYNEFFTFEYSMIDKIEIKPVLFLKDKVALIRIFPKFETTNPFKWRFRIFKEQGVKLPQHLQRSYHVLYNVSNYEPLLRILEHHHVKLINK